MSTLCKTPIAYFVFNRPRHTRHTFDVIRAQRPARLLIVADGPRLNHPTDAERCSEVRSIVSQIDWPCDVSLNYSDINLGCKRRMSSGLDWVFEQVETAVILEDDCVPNDDFFIFCDELLERYADNPDIWVITGNNHQQGRKRSRQSYYFSRYNHIWGWATWRRAWKHYDVEMSFWPTWKDSANWHARIPDPVERKVWSAIFDKVKAGLVDTWDYQWTACVWYHGGLTVTPNVNLVTNIGFGADATHTVTKDDEEGIPALPLGPITHPSVIKQHRAADRFVFNHNFGGNEHPDRLLNLLKKRFGQLQRAPQFLPKQILKLSRRLKNGK